MEKEYIPHKVLQKVISQKVKRKEISDQLISILENCDDSRLRILILNKLISIVPPNDMHFDFYENYLVSDVNDEIRAVSAKIIFLYYIEKGLNVLKWTILNDKSSLVINTLRNLIQEVRNSFSMQLEPLLRQRIKGISQKYELSCEEIPFLLDIGVNNMGSNYYIGNQDFHFIYEADILCIIKKNHITDLGLSFFKEIPESIGLLSELECMNLSYGYLSGLPISIKNLTQLKFIDLSWNEFEVIPKVLKELKNVNNINLSNNKIEKMPNWALSLKNIIL